VKRLLAPLTVVALAVGLLGACSDAPSATDKVCAARDDLQTSVAKVSADVRAADFGKARQGLPDVQKAIDELRDTVGDLTSEQVKALEPHVEAVRNLLGNLNYVRSLAELKVGLAAIGAQLAGIHDLVTNTLQCP